MTPATTKPTIVLVPGVFHTPQHFSPLIPHLNGYGYPTTVVSLPSIDSSSPFDESVSKDSMCVHSILEEFLDEERDIILAAHSYGGLPSCAAAKGLMKSEREAQGKMGGIIAQVYIAAFVAPEGVSLLQLAGGQHAPWIIRNVR